MPSADNDNDHGLLKALTELQKDILNICSIVDSATATAAGATTEAAAVAPALIGTSMSELIRHLGDFLNNLSYTSPLGDLGVLVTYCFLQLLDKLDPLDPLLNRVMVPDEQKEQMKKKIDEVNKRYPYGLRELEIDVEKYEKNLQQCWYHMMQDVVFAHAEIYYSNRKASERLLTTFSPAFQQSLENYVVRQRFVRSIDSKIPSRTIYYDWLTQNKAIKQNIGATSSPMQGASNNVQHYAIMLLARQWQHQNAGKFVRKSSANWALLQSLPEKTRNDVLTILGASPDVKTKISVLLHRDNFKWRTDSQGKKILADFLEDRLGLGPLLTTPVLDKDHKNPLNDKRYYEQISNNMLGGRQLQNEQAGVSRGRGGPAV